MAVDPEAIRKARHTFERQAAYWKIESERYADQALRAQTEQDRAAQLAGAASAREASDQAQELADRQDKALGPALTEQVAAQAREAAQAEQRAQAEGRDAEREQAAEADRAVAKAEQDRIAARAAEIDLQMARNRIERGNGRHANRYRDL